MSSSIVLRMQADFVAVRLSFEPWLPGGKRPKPGTSRAMAAAANVAEESTRSSLAKYNVRIPSIKAVNAWRSAVRAYVESVTVYGPYSNLRFLPRTDLTAFESTMQGFQGQLPGLTAAVQSDRGVIVQDAQQRLNGEFDLADYPADLSTLFGMAWDYPAIAVDQSLPEEIQERQQSQLSTQLSLDAERVELQLLEEFQDAAAHLAAVLKLDGKGEGIGWKTSTLNKVTELAERVRRLSILQTPWLLRDVTAAHQLLSGRTADSLKDRPVLAASVADLLTAIVERSGPHPVPVQPTKPACLDHEALCPKSECLVI